MANETLEITGRIELIGINPYVLVSTSQAAILKPGWRGPMPVLIHINGERDARWQTNMMPNGKGDFYLYLHGDMRKKSKTKVGDVVTLNIVFDAAYRNGPLHPIPAWFQTALDENPSALMNWQKLPPSRQKEILRHFHRLKSDEAKERNLAQVLVVLAGNTGHFMGRDWVDGR